MKDKNFFIPGGIEYLMPEEAIEFEKLKSNVLGIFKKYNYEYVIPPIIDNLTNLLSLNSSDVDQLTVTFTDQISGKQIGLRSDITSQIAMIDYQQSKSGLSRFGYMGDIVRISKSLFDRKNPFQVGAELFGCSKKSHDLEIINLMTDVIHLTKQRELIIEIGDLSVINKIIKSLDITEADQSYLVQLINTKSTDEIQSFLKHKNVKKNSREGLVTLISLSGDFKVLNEIETIASKFDSDISEKIDNLKYLAKKVSQFSKSINVVIDLSDLYSLDYQSSLTFSAYIENYRQAIARGGRYVAYGKSGNQPRNACGFSLDLKDIFFQMKEVRNA